MGDMLTSIYLQSKTSGYSTVDKQGVQISQNNDFEKCFNKSIDNKSNVKDFDRKANENYNKDNNNYKENTNSDKKEISKTQINKKDNIKETVIEDDNKSKEEIEAEIASILASLLNIDVEQVQQFIENNQLTNDNIKEFIMTELNLGNATQLLEVENIGQILKEIGALIEEIDVTYEELQTFESILNEELLDNNTKKFQDDEEKISMAMSVESQDELATVTVDSESEDVVLLESEVNEEVRTDVEDGVEIVTTTEESNNFLNYTSDEPENIFGVTSENIEVKGTQNFSKIANSTFRNINSQDVIKQLVDSVKVNFDPSFTEIKIQLSPENLGDVTLKVVTENGIVTAQFVAENEKVKEIIESNFTDLSDTLKQKGISVSELSVSVGQDDSNNRDTLNHFNKERSKSSSRVTQILKGIEDEEIKETIEYIDSYGMTQSTVSYSV